MDGDVTKSIFIGRYLGGVTKVMKGWKQGIVLMLSVIGFIACRLAKRVALLVNTCKCVNASLVQLEAFVMVTATSLASVLQAHTVLLE
jgi:hypothetical protein